MLAFRLKINGQEICTAGTESVLSLSLLAHGDRFPENERTVNVNLAGTVEPSTVATWIEQLLSVGDKVEIAVVDVAASAIDEPSRVTTFEDDIDDIIERRQAAYFSASNVET
jgi:hypothetical protein